MCGVVYVPHRDLGADTDTTILYKEKTLKIEMSAGNEETSQLQWHNKTVCCSCVRWSISYCKRQYGDTLAVRPQSSHFLHWMLYWTDKASSNSKAWRTLYCFSGWFDLDFCRFILDSDWISTRPTPIRCAVNVGSWREFYCWIEEQFNCGMLK